MTRSCWGRFKPLALIAFFSVTLLEAGSAKAEEAAQELPLLIKQWNKALRQSADGRGIPGPRHEILSHLSNSEAVAQVKKDFGIWIESQIFSRVKGSGLGGNLQEARLRGSALLGLLKLRAAAIGLGSHHAQGSAKAKLIACFERQNALSFESGTKHEFKEILEFYRKLLIKRMNEIEREFGSVFTRNPNQELLDQMVDLILGVPVGLPQIAGNKGFTSNLYALGFPHAAAGSGARPYEVNVSVMRMVRINEENLGNPALLWFFLPSQNVRDSGRLPRVDSIVRNQELFKIEQNGNKAPEINWQNCGY